VELRGETIEPKAQKRPEPKRPTFRVTRRLPEGVTVEEARQQAAEAVAEWLSEGTR
jgi:hypothetical protein